MLILLNAPHCTVLQIVCLSLIVVYWCTQWHSWTDNIEKSPYVVLCLYNINLLMHCMPMDLPHVGRVWVNDLLFSTSHIWPPCHTTTATALRPDKLFITETVYLERRDLARLREEWISSRGWSRLTTRWGRRSLKHSILLLRKTKENRERKQSQPPR